MRATFMFARLTVIRLDWLAVELERTTDEDRAILSLALAAGVTAAGAAATAPPPVRLGGNVWVGMVRGGSAAKAREAVVAVLRARDIPIEPF